MSEEEEHQHHNHHHAHHHQYEVSPPSHQSPRNFNNPSSDDSFDCEPIDFRLPLPYPPSHGAHLYQQRDQIERQQYYPSPTDGQYEDPQDQNNIIPTPHSYHPDSSDTYHHPGRKHQHHQRHPGYDQHYERTPSLPSPPKLPKRDANEDRPDHLAQQHDRQEQKDLVHPPYRRSRGIVQESCSHPSPPMSEVVQQKPVKDETPTSSSTTSSSLLSRGRTQVLYDMRPPVMLSSSSFQDRNTHLGKEQQQQGVDRQYHYQHHHPSTEAPSFDSHPSAHHRHHHYHASDDPSRQAHPIVHPPTAYPRQQPSFGSAEESSPPMHPIPPPAVMSTSSYPYQHPSSGYVLPPGMPYPQVPLSRDGSHPPEYAGHGHHPYGPPGMYPYPPHPHFYQHAGSSPVVPTPLAFVKEVNNNDVLCGRGGATNSHVGNRKFRALVKSHQERYLLAKKKEKPAVAAYVVTLVRNLSPSGRFLKKDKTSGNWYDIGDEKAKEKTAQALREGAPALRRQRERGEYSGDSSDGGSPGGRGGGSDGAASPDGSNNGSATNAVSPSSMSQTQGDGNQSNTSPNSASGESDGSKKRKRSVVEIEEVVIPTDVGDDLGVEQEVSPPRPYREVSQGTSMTIHRATDEREDTVKGRGANSTKLKNTKSEDPSTFSESDSTIQEERDEASSGSTEDGSHSAETREGLEQDNKLQVPSPSSSSDGSLAARATCSIKEPRISRKPVIIRPSLTLTKKELPAINVEELSPEDQQVYMADFVPPRANLQRGPRDRQRKIIKVTEKWRL